MSQKSKATESPRLVVIEGPEKGRIVPLRAGTLVIGRSKGDVVIQDARISRSHVAIHVDEQSGKVTFTDLKSLNGVQLNGDSKETGQLRDGDRLQLGNTTFDCQTQVVEDSSTEPAIRIGKKKQDPQREEKTDVSEMSFLDELRPEPTRFGEPVFETEGSKSENRLVNFYQGLPKRTRVYGGAAVLLLAVLIFIPSGKKSSEKAVDRDFASIRKLEEQGKLTEAAAQAETVKASQPTNPQVYRLLGDLYTKQQHWEQSIEAYKRSFDLDSKQIEILPKLARLYLTNNNIPAAQSVNGEIDHYLTQGPENREFFVAVANLYLDFPRLELRSEKMVIIGHAIQTKYAPDDVSGYKLEALGHLDQGQAEEALRVLEKAKTLFPNDESVYLFLVLGRVKMKDFEAANQVVDQWIGIFPNSLQPLVLMGQLKYQLKEYDESMKYLQKAVQIGGQKKQDSNFPKALFLLGELYYQQNQVVEAENALRQSCEMGMTEGCEHVLIKGQAEGTNAFPPEGSQNRAPQSLKSSKRKK